jgi:ribosome-associated translation inhibitor RaiA
MRMGRCFRQGRAGPGEAGNPPITDDEAAMQVQVNTDRNIHGREALAQHVEGVVGSVLGHLAGQVTRVEVHLSDANAQKSGAADKRCLMEVRPEGRPPVAASDEADNLHQAIRGAAEKLRSALDTSLGRLDRNRRDSLRDLPAASDAASALREDDPT